MMFDIPGAIKAGVGLATDIMDRIIPPKATEKERIDATIAVARDETLDVQSARQTLQAMWQNQKMPWLVLLASGLVRPIGAYCALFCFFFNIAAGWLGYEHVPLSAMDYYTIDGILIFYYGSRHREKMQRVIK